MSRPPARLLLLLAVLPSALPAARVWMLVWSGHQMNVLATVPASSRAECGVRCARLKGCVAASYNISDGPNASCQLLSCQLGWVALNANCYVIFANPLSWLDANVVCVSQAAHLVSIHSALENLFVDLLADAHGIARLHLGLQSDGASHQWTDGTPLDFINWAEGEGSLVSGPDTSFLPATASLLAAQGSSWADNGAGDSYHFMCKRAKVLPP